MSGLIEEIQRGALDDNIPIEALLRRVKLAAAKLQLPSLEKWVQQELSGYTEEVPDYRKAYGQPAAWNPYHGWQPLRIDDDWLSDLVSNARIGQSISGLRDLLQNGSGDGVLHFPIPAGLVAELNKLMNYPTPRIVIQLSRGHIVGIVDQVRSMVLDWAIEMERQGVIGEGISFSAVEKEEAKQVMANITVGSIGNFTGNMGTGITSGDMNVSGASVSQIKETLSKIKAALPELQGAGANTADLSKIVDVIDIEVRKEKPDASRLKTLLTDARATLVGAAGNLTAEGAVAGIAALLKLFGSN